MKKAVFLAVAVLMVQISGCSGNNNKKVSSSDPEGKPTEKLLASNSTPDKTTNLKGGTINLTKAMFIERVMDYETNTDKWVYKGDKPCLIDFYADWCAPCRMASPILDEIAREYADKIYIYKIDTEKERELASVFRIQGIPAFLLVPMEGMPSMSSGVGRTKEETKQMFVEMIEGHLLK